MVKTESHATLVSSSNTGRQSEKKEKQVNYGIGSKRVS